MKSLQENGFGAVPEVGTDWFASIAAMGTEIMAFTAARIQQDLQMQQALLSAKGISEVQKIQMDFFQKAMEDYSTEINKLINIKTSPEARGTGHHSTPV